MFHDIPDPVLAQMHRLEEIDARDRLDGTPHLQRLRQIPPETGRFLTLLAAGAPQGSMVEIGTSAGYSTLWLWLAARLRGQKLITFEILEQKFNLARQVFQAAGIAQDILQIQGDARLLLPGYKDIAFCFLDAEKETYAECYHAAIPNLVPGGLLVADNALSHQETLQPVIDQALDDRRVDALLVPIGKGELVCRKI